MEVFLESDTVQHPGRLHTAIVLSSHKTQLLGRVSGPVLTEQSPQDRGQGYNIYRKDATVFTRTTSLKSSKPCSCQGEEGDPLKGRKVACCPFMFQCVDELSIILYILEEMTENPKT